MSVEWGGYSLPKPRPSLNLPLEGANVETLGTIRTAAVNLLPGDVVRVNIAASPLLIPQYAWWTVHHVEVSPPNKVEIHYAHSTKVTHTVMWYCQITVRWDA